MKKFASCDSCVSFLSIEGKIYQLWQACIKVYINFCCIKRNSKLKSSLWIPFYEILFFVRSSLFIIDYGVSMPTNFTKQVKNLGGYILSVKLLVVIIRLKHLLKLKFLLTLLLSASLGLRVNLKVLWEFREHLFVQFHSHIHWHLIEPLF